MLGAVKGDDAEIGVPLFRLLARRWRSFAPVKRKRVKLVSMVPADQEPEPEPTRQWVSKPRRLPVIAPRPRPDMHRPTWNRWLWMK